MARLPHRCVMISVCLAGTLLLLPLCSGVDEDQYNFDYEEYTHTPEYDYNSTFDFTFFSNASSDDLEKFLMGVTESGKKTSFTETDGSVHEKKSTTPTAPITESNQASRSTPVCFLLTLVVLVHQLLRLL
ncbi:uncharacterized protein si:ch211-191i18.2 [Pseudorasbora parva]|uniref:uncharacterized protein si:ch211-191i18.2 n=1 Tax=Pseudorasbora parva TaxID=51549 RepID=UPI00351DD369